MSIIATIGATLWFILGIWILSDKKRIDRLTYFITWLLLMIHLIGRIWA